ncbi:MAG: ribonuclease HI [Verrucomicrobiota bacterium]|mgnify:CR=1 FL=1|nr:ribonuclease HI [Verrucomicrobiota bacterium]
MKKIIIHTDGGCHGNPGPGGWAATLSHAGNSRTISGGCPATTNNRMELTAALEALKSLKEPCDVVLFTDSSYLRNGVTEWIRLWKRNGWKTKARQPVKNADLWIALDEATTHHKISWQWVKGHAGDAGNEKCDELANTEIAKIKQEYSTSELKELLGQFAQSEIKSGTSDELLPLRSPPPAGKPLVQGDLF